MIRVENLHKYFGDLKVLKGINEHIQEGEVAHPVQEKAPFYAA